MLPSRSTSVVDERRVSRVADVVARIGTEPIYVIEASDPQFVAVRKLVVAHGSRALALVVANALVSYRLTMPGEEYWLEFAEWFSKKPISGSADNLISLFGVFLRGSRGNRVLADQKLARLRRVKGVIESLLAEPMRYRDLGLLVEELERVFKPAEPSKTVFFAAKMAYYVYRVLGEPVKGVWRPGLPVDKRLALLAASSRIVSVGVDEAYTRHRKSVFMAWRMVSKKSRVPPINLDALLWLPARGVEQLLRRGMLQSARDEYARRLVMYSRGQISWSLAEEAASQLIHVNPFAKPRQE